MWNLKCSSRTCYHWGVRERNSRIYSTLTVASKLARFEFSWLKRERNIAREGVRNIHHWSGRDETATENGVDQAGSCRHCASHSSVMASLPIIVRQGRWRTFWALSLTFITVLLVILCCRCWRHEQLLALRRPILAYCPFWRCDAVI